MIIRTTTPSPTSSHISPHERLLQFLASEKQDLWIVVIYGAFAGFFALVIPLAAQSFVNTIGFESMMQPLFVLAFLVFIALTFAGLMSTMQSYIMEVIQQRIFARVAIDLAYRIPRVQIAAYDANQGAELVNRFFEVIIIQKSAAILVLDGAAVILQTLLGMILISFYHPYLLVFDIFLIASISFVIFGFINKGISTSIDESKAKYEVVAWLEELARNPLAFKSHGGLPFAMIQTDELTARYVNYRKKHFRILLKQMIGSFSIQVLASSLLLGLGGWLVVHRELTLGQLVASELVVTSVVAGFAKFGKYLETYYDLVASSDKLGNLFDLPLESSQGEGLGTRSGAVQITLKEINYKSPNAKNLFSGLSLKVDSGSKIAITGENGSGKSTLLNLIFGLRKPDSGGIEINGIDLREISPEQLRLQIAMVRGIEVFNGSVLENVRMNRTEISTRQVREALKQVDLLDEVTALPDGLSTLMLGAQHPLSTGQMQRLMIARAIVSQPCLLLLDDPLTGLDTRAHRRILDILVDKNAPWTLIMTTHETPHTSQTLDIFNSFDSIGRLNEGKLEIVKAT